MDVNSWVSAIGSVGFPIIACCGLFYLYNETITKITNTLDLLNKSVEMLAEELKREDKQDDQLSWFVAHGAKVCLFHCRYLHCVPCG